MKRILDHGGKSLRSDLAQIAKWVAPHARVLDLGCGDGTLLHWLAVQHSSKHWALRSLMKMCSPVSNEAST